MPPFLIKETVSTRGIACALCEGMVLEKFTSDLDRILATEQVLPPDEQVV
jgi:hypothetical protein